MSVQDEYPLLWRKADLNEVPAIKRIGDKIHFDLPERLEVFVEKFRLFPQGCLVLCKSGATVGYGIFHPWRLYSVPPCDTFLQRLPPFPDCMFIHDVVVLPAARGLGAAGEFVQMTAEVASEQGIAALALVSVRDTYPFWARYGFEVITDPVVDEKLKSYGPSARYMIRVARPLSA